MLTNLQTIDAEQASQLTQFFCRTGGVIFLFGQSGVGKSRIAIDSILAAGYKANYLNLSVIERPDLSGYPDIYAKGDVVKFKSPYFLPNLPDGEKPSKILILDEIDKAATDTTFPLLELLQSRTINGERKDVAAVVLTGNLPNEDVGGYSISKALLGRGARYELKFDFDKWMIWARANGIHDLILGFLQYNQQLCCCAIEHSMLAAPNPRSWELASQAIIKAREVNLVDIESITALVSGFVGAEVGTLFRTWYSHYRQFEPFALNLVEKGISPSEWEKWSPTERVIFVITAAHLARLKFIAASKTKPKYAVVERLVEFLDGVEPELQALALANSFDAGFVVDPAYRLYQCKAFFEMSSKLSGK